MHRSLIVTGWGWTQWTFLYFMVSGTCSLVTVHQPPVLATALGHDVMMPCQLFHNETMVTSPVLYWWYLTQNTVNPRVWIPSEKYEGRVDLLDHNANSSNKSILLRNVQWADTGKYLCKLSVNTESDGRSRKNGSETHLMVYDTMIFNLTSHNESLLWCEVNVTPDPGFVLSIVHDGCKLQAVDSAPGDAVAALSYVTLSEAVTLRGGGKYECHLHMNKDLIVKSIFHYHPSVAEKGGDAEKKVSQTHSTTVSEPDVVEFPEPWLLYVAVLLVPLTILLALATALICKICLSTSG